jgi:hypothetical protein
VCVVLKIEVQICIVDRRAWLFFVLLLYLMDRGIPFFVELEFQYSMSRRSFERVLPNKRSWEIFPASVSET